MASEEGERPPPAAPRLGHRFGLLRRGVEAPLGGISRVVEAPLDGLTKVVTSTTKVVTSTLAQPYNLGRTGAEKYVFGDGA